MRDKTLLLLVILFACKPATKPEDFVGSYYFLKVERVKESNVLAPNQGNWLLNHPDIYYYDTSPLEMELFMVEGKIDGKLTFYEFESASRSALGNTYSRLSSYELPLGKFRLVDDTLVFEIDASNFLQTISYTTYLVKRENESFIGLEKDLFGKDLKLISTLSTYRGEDNHSFYFASILKAHQDSIRNQFLEDQINLMVQAGEKEKSYDVKFLEAKLRKLREPDTQTEAIR